MLLTAQLNWENLLYMMTLVGPEDTWLPFKKNTFACKIGSVSLQLAIIIKMMIKRIYFAGGKKSLQGSHSMTSTKLHIYKDGY